jgi:hypothetical protein
LLVDGFHKDHRIFRFDEEDEFFAGKHSRLKG